MTQGVFYWYLLLKRQPVSKRFNLGGYHLRKNTLYCTTQISRGQRSYGKNKQDKTNPIPWRTHWTRACRQCQNLRPTQQHLYYNRIIRLGKRLNNDVFRRSTNTFGLGPGDLEKNCWRTTLAASRDPASLHWMVRSTPSTYVLKMRRCKWNNNKEATSMMQELSSLTDSASLPLNLPILWFYRWNVPRISLKGHLEIYALNRD